MFEKALVAYLLAAAAPPIHASKQQPRKDGVEQRNCGFFEGAAALRALPHGLLPLLNNDVVAELVVADAVLAEAAEAAALPASHWPPNDVLA